MKIPPFRSMHLLHGVLLSMVAHFVVAVVLAWFVSVPGEGLTVFLLLVCLAPFMVAFLGPLYAFLAAPQAAIREAQSHS